MDGNTVTRAQTVLDSLRRLSTGSITNYRYNLFDPSPKALYIVSDYNSYRHAIFEGLSN